MVNTRRTGWREQKEGLPRDVSKPQAGVTGGRDIMAENWLYHGMPARRE